MSLITRVAMALCLGLTSSLTIAAPELIISRAFNIKAVNGAIYPSGLISQDRKVKLRVGKNLLAIEYEEVFDADDGDNFDVIKSSPFLLTVYLHKEGVYRQKIVKPSDADAARKFANNPIFQIVNVSKQNNQNKVRFSLIPLISANDSYLIHQTRMRQNATLDLSHPNPKSGKIANKQSLQTPTNQSMATKMLNYWWQQASPKEKELFLKSIKGKN